MPPPKQPPKDVDLKPSTRWGIAALKSLGMGLGPVGASLGVYDLVNMTTTRAHRMSVTSGGIGKGFKVIPFSGSFLNDDYTYFTTARPVSFLDFNDKPMRVTTLSVVLYSWNYLTIFDEPLHPLLPVAKILARLKTSGGGLSTPDLGMSIGTTEILFGDGRPVETPTWQLPTPVPTDVERHFGDRTEAKDHVAVIKIPENLLFDFNKYILKPEADKTLRQIGRYIRSQERYKRLLIRGHTDSKGSESYNLTLSKRRAEAVAKWYTSRGLLNAQAVKTEGMGESRPEAPNKKPNGQDDPIGRAKNRRVEFMLYE